MIFSKKSKLFIINYFESVEKEIETEFEQYIINHANQNRDNDMINLNKKKAKLINKVNKTKLLNLREFEASCCKLLEKNHGDKFNFDSEGLNDQINSLLFSNFCFHIKYEWLKKV